MTDPAVDPVTATAFGAPWLAVDVRPDGVPGTFMLDESELDGPDALAWTDLDSGLWMNVVCDVQAVSFRRGATRLQGILTQTEAGTCSITLSDTLRAFDPMANQDAIHKGTPLRLRAWGYDLDGELQDLVLFTGQVDQVGATYHPEDPPTVTITGLDVVGSLAAWESEGRPEPGVGAGDNLRQRVERVLAESGVGSISPDSDAAFTATLGGSQLAQPWQDLTAATEAELGRLWVNRDNQLVVRARGSELAGPVRGTLSDVHGEAPLGAHCCIGDAAVAYGAETMANRVMASRQVLQAPGDATVVPEVLVRRDDEYSQARYGVGAISRTALELETDAQLQPWAEAVIVANTTPELRVDRVVPTPSQDDLDSAVPAWLAVLATDVGDRWLFRYHPKIGPVVDRAIGVLGIELEATPEGWTVAWSTGPAPVPGRSTALGWFVLDESQLDAGDVLAPYATAA